MSAEIWLPVVGYEGLYEVSSLGRLRSIPRATVISSGNRSTFKGKFLSTAKTASRRYQSVHLSKNGVLEDIRVSRAVAVAFIPNPENKPQVNHINGDKNDNRVENLEWVTGSENQQHSRDVLGNMKLDKHPLAKLRSENIYAIRLLAFHGETQKAISEIFNVSRSTIGYVLSGKNWRGVGQFLDSN